MNKITNLLYLTADIVFIVCVTYAAMYFGKTSILWWYVLVLFLRAYRGQYGGAK